MRVTDKMGYNQVTQNLQKNRGEMSELQNQAATQKRINKPSDDPIAAARVLGARTDEKMNKQFLKNMDIAKSFLEASDQSLGELTENLVRAKELTIQAANDPGGGPETRKISALEIEQIYAQAVQIGNRKLGERYIFGGYKTTAPPFDRTGNYKGDDGDMKIQINKDSFLAMNVTGDKVLLGKGIGEDGIIRAGGDTPKTTTDLQEYKLQEQQRLIIKDQSEQEALPVRGPASVSSRSQTQNSDYESNGVNILQSLKNLEIGLRVNDKAVVQDSIDFLDQAISQVIHTRAQVGARLMSLTSNADTLQKQVVENKMTASQLEDVDLYQVVSEMQKADSTMKATLETSGKVIQPSLLDFLK